MGRYVVDGRPLDSFEEILLKGFLNAAMNGLVGAQRSGWGATNDEDRYARVSRLAHDHAEAMLREYRRRIGLPVKVPPAEAAAYRLIGQEEVVRRWLGTEGPSLRIAHILLLGRLRGLTYPLTLAEVAVGGDIPASRARELVNAGILVPAEEGDDAAR